MNDITSRMRLPRETSLHLTTRLVAAPRHASPDRTSLRKALGSQRSHVACLCWIQLHFTSLHFTSSRVGKLRTWHVSARDKEWKVFNTACTEY